MGKYYLECALEEEKIDATTYKGYKDDQKAKYKEKALELYLEYVFMKGVKCKPSVQNTKAALDKLYKIHKNKDIYPKTLVAAMHLHQQSYRDNGRKKKTSRRRMRRMLMKLPEAKKERTKPMVGTQIIIKQVKMDRWLWRISIKKTTKNSKKRFWLRYGTEIIVLI